MRTPEQEKQWQAAREKIITLIYHCYLSSPITLDQRREDCADAILDLPVIEVRDMNTDKLLSVLALDDPEVKQRFNDLSEAFVKVIPK